MKFVFEEFYKHGAEEEILYSYKPHIGTDVLTKIVKNIREEIIKLGGKFYFNTTFIDAKEKDESIDVYAKNKNEELVFNTNSFFIAFKKLLAYTF